MQALPNPSPRFVEKKSKILQQLAVPNSEYTDASPKGSVDEGIRELIDQINLAPGFVTTSSCAGRMSVFLEGRRTAGDDETGQVAGVGGKGAGGTWLYVSHEAVEDEGDAFQDFVGQLGLDQPEEPQTLPGNVIKQRLIHFKFEPMILHVLTASLIHAQVLLRCALQAGFRESGAVNISNPPSVSGDSVMPMVAIRSMGLSFESLVGFETEDGRRCNLVSRNYLQSLLHIANERFGENTKRIDRFQTAFGESLKGAPPKKNSQGEEWEDPAARRERKRAEGLRRKAELEERSQGTAAGDS